MDDYRDIFISIVEKHKNHTKWNSGDFIGMKSISNTKVGTVGQEFIENICEFLKIPFSFPLNKKNLRAMQSPWDIKINNINFELKTATEDTHSKFQFNHIRYHRDYQAVLCLGVSPNDLFFNLWDKADINVMCHPMTTVPNRNERQKDKCKNIQ
jgi:hypothetical protein